MGLLRSLVSKVAGRVSGNARAPAPGASAPSGPAPALRPPAPVSRPQAPAAAPPVAARPAADTPAAPESYARMECGVQELKERMEAGEIVVVVDVRESAELAEGLLPGARHLPLSSLEGRWQELQHADEIVCYCAMGGRSLHAATFLRSKGLINATSLEGGIQAWRAIGGATPRQA